MPYRPLPRITVILLGLLAGCTTHEYKVVGFAANSVACQIHDSVCVETPVFRIVDYEKEDMLLTYASDQPDEKAAKILKKYNLRAKRNDLLGSINLKMVTAATNGQDPYDLTQTINRQETDVEAATNNVYRSTTVAAGPADVWPLQPTKVLAARQQTSGAGVTVGMIDTPIDLTHESLRSNSQIHQFNLVPYGDHTNRVHGTQVAGVILSRNPLVGIAPDARLIAISAFTANPQNPEERRSNSSLVARALEIAIKEGVQVLNLSFAGKPDPVVDKLVQVALERGITVVASAGNSGPHAEPAYPAALPGVVAVTAVDKAGNLFPQANRGDYIDLAAPGVGILTTTPNNSYQIANGTSLATAHVSGILALLKAINPSFHAEQLLQTAADLGAPGYDPEYGFGLAQTDQAMRPR